MSKQRTYHRSGVMVIFDEETKERRIEINPEIIDPPQQYYLRKRPIKQEYKQSIRKIWKNELDKDPFKK